MKLRLVKVEHELTVSEKKTILDFIVACLMVMLMIAGSLIQNPFLAIIVPLTIFLSYFLGLYHARLNRKEKA